MKKKLLVLGLWADGTGPLIENVVDCDVLPMLGISTMKERAAKLLEYLRDHQSITTLIGHSAGCSVITEISQILPEQVKTVMLLNPAPLPGVKFSLQDLAFWKMGKPRYLWAMLRCKPLALTHEDAGQLLGYPPSHEIIRSLKPDSGQFIREITKRQLFWWKRPVKFRNTVLVILYRTRADRMIGTTQIKTEELLNPEYECLVLCDEASNSNHLTPLIRFQEVLGKINTPA